MVVEQLLQCALTFICCLHSVLARAKNDPRTDAACGFCRDTFNPFDYQHAWFVGFHELSTLPLAGSCSVFCPLDER